MAHERTTHDHLVLHRTKAWHGLGTIVEDAPSPRHALQLAHLDWEVQQLPMEAYYGPDRIEIASHVLNVCSLDARPLGVVGTGYRPVQNRELADFVAALGHDDQVKLESAGSIRSGRRVWFLAKSASIWLNAQDEVKPYLLVANAHDGSMAVTCLPTTIRVVCSNTLHASLSHSAGTRVHFRHEGQVASKLEDARRALTIYKKSMTTFTAQAQALVAAEMSRDDLQRFWLEVYAATQHPIPLHPSTKKEIRDVETAKEVLATWAQNFDQDRQQTRHGASRWVAVNAVTHWFDHQRPTRARSDQHRTENRVASNWWGTSAAAKARTLAMALQR
jgi:phage/plasmid-like protein (TIGR03299 family)